VPGDHPAREALRDRATRTGLRPRPCGARPLVPPRRFDPAQRTRPAAATTRADGTYARLFARLERIDVLVIDDWGTGTTQEQERNDLLEIMDDRHGTRSTIVASQLPIDKWHASIGEPTIADAILDRLFHNAHRIVLKGASRKKGEVKLDAE